MLVALLMIRSAAAQAPPVAATATPQPRQGSVKFKRLPNGDIRLGGITVHRKARQVSFKAKINQMAGPLEVLIATPVGRLHESLLCADISPLHLQTVLYLLDLKNGPRRDTDAAKQGTIIDVDVEWSDKDGKTFREPVEHWVVDQQLGKPMQRSGWVFVGSSIIDGAFQADVGGNIVLVYTGADTILDIPGKGGDDDTIFVAN